MLYTFEPKEGALVFNCCDNCILIILNIIGKHMLFLYWCEEIQIISILTIPLIPHHIKLVSGFPDSLCARKAFFSIRLRTQIQCFDIVCVWTTPSDQITLCMYVTVRKLNS